MTSQVLKSTTGWFECDDYERCYDSGNGSDDFGFAALPAGVIASKSDFDDFGGSYRFRMAVPMLGLMPSRNSVLNRMTT